MTENQDECSKLIYFGIIFIAGILLILPSIIIKEIIGSISVKCNILRIVGYTNMILSGIFIFITPFKKRRMKKR